MKVRYNGEKNNYYGCFLSNKLIVGQEYNVLAVLVNDWQTNYVLKEINWYFNSNWFDKVEEDFFAFVKKKPVVNERLDCIKITNEDDKLVVNSHYYISIVEKIEKIGSDTFKVKTLNSIYIVKVI